MFNFLKELLQSVPDNKSKMEKIDSTIGSCGHREDFNVEFIANNHVQWAEMFYNHEEQRSVLLVFTNEAEPLNFYVDDLIDSLRKAKNQLESFETGRENTATDDLIA